MLNNFLYSAYSYLDEWMQRDRCFYTALAFERENQLSVEEGANCLVEVAKYYKVIRTLTDTGEKPRLKAGYEALQATGPLVDGDAAGMVERFAKSLHTSYGKYALSAASKFLWMRFRSPVIIYDKFAAEWLSKHCGYTGGGYSSYHKIWSREYPQFQERIREACRDLQNVKRFTLACNVSEEQFSEWITSRWFMERVLDHHMVNGFPPK